MTIHAAAEFVTVRDILRSADRIFTSAPSAGAPEGNVRLVNDDGIRIELVPPTLLGAYLIEDPVRTVMLYKSGVEIKVPSPERCAIHELMMSARAQMDR